MNEISWSYIIHDFDSVCSMAVDFITHDIINLIICSRSPCLMNHTVCEEKESYTVIKCYISNWFYT